jgi:dihydropteroate synthase
MTREWHIANDRTLPIGERTLIMGVLNVTPDSFSDGGQFYSIDKALAHAAQMIAEGADIIDVGGESTRPGGAAAVSADEEIRRVIPVIEGLAKISSVPVSIDTTKSKVVRAALDVGAAIVNDISGLRFDPDLANEAARTGAGLVLMHSRGTMETLHQLPPVADIFTEVISGLRTSITLAEQRGVKPESIVIDPGIGFGKSQAQNIELIANLEILAAAFPESPILLGTSRKSFVGKLLANENGKPAPPEQRLYGTMATITSAVVNGAPIVRVHDVKVAVETITVAQAIKRAHHRRDV